MTLLVSLDEDARTPPAPAFVAPVADPATFRSKVVGTVLKARRIAVVCGAGISVQAGIPDFRSADGLFQSIKKDNPKENLASGKDLFDASVFSSENTTSLFCQMIARLSCLSTNATPTHFHNLLRELDGRGKLLRVFTQNIDALEEKAGMSLGLPYRDGARAKSKTRTAKGDESQSATDYAGPVASSSKNTTPAPGESTPEARMSPLPRGTPRCIPLHGTLQTMHCVSCSHAYPLSDHLSSLLAGVPPDCPECISLEATRSLVGKRSRKIGKLRPSVVLYNEDHRDGEGVGEVVRRDLFGGGRGRGGADLLIVVGTSLKVPGTKRIVKEFAKSSKAKADARAEKAREAAMAKLPLPTPAPTPDSSRTSSPRRSPAIDVDVTSTFSPAPELPPEERPITTIYINLDFPAPARDWDGVFDVWLQGDAQIFADMVVEGLERDDRVKAEREEKEERAREERRERDFKRKREREEREAEKEEREMLASSKAKVSVKRKKRELSSLADDRPAKKRRVKLVVREPPPTPLLRKGSTLKNYLKVAKSTKVMKGKEPMPSIITTPSPSSKTKGGRPSSALASQAPHTFRPRYVPEVVITVPSPNTGKSLQNISERDSPLDLLANAAASLSLAKPRPGSSSVMPIVSVHSSHVKHPYQARRTPNGYTYTSPSPCPCPYPYSLQCDCRVRLQTHSFTRSQPDELHCADHPSFCSPLSSVSTLTPVPSPLLLHAVPLPKSSGGRDLVVDETSREAHSPGPPPPSVPKTLKPDIWNLLNPETEETPESSSSTDSTKTSPVDGSTSMKRRRSRGPASFIPSKTKARRKKARVAAALAWAAESDDSPLITPTLETFGTPVP